jgi:hypothetical protein
MPRKDTIHEAVKTALIRDGWTITADPYRLDYGEDRFFVDLAAELPLAAERQGRRIAVEIKSFLSRSAVADLQDAIGQYAFYLALLEEVDPQRRLYLALSQSAFEELAEMRAFARVQERFQVSLMIVHLDTETISQWID